LTKTLYNKELTFLHYIFFLHPSMLHIFTTHFVNAKRSSMGQSTF
jgi:hypothetical protein